MMEAKKINEFNKLVFNNGTKENKDLLLENNPEIKELLENSPFDKIIDEDNRVGALFTLHFLTCNLNDGIARKILTSKLKDLYETGNINFIEDYVGLSFFEGLFVEDLLDLIFESDSLLTHNFLTSLEKCSISADSLKKFLIKLSKEDYEATSYLLIESFLLLGYAVRTDYKFRDAVSQWHIWEEFNLFREE